MKRNRNGKALLKSLVRADEGVMSPWVFVDPDLYQMELERIFARSWLFVAHESEIPKDRLISFLTLRQWQPSGPDKMEIWSWGFVDRNAPEWWKQVSRECYLRAFGMAGVFEQDDMENWGEITDAFRSPRARELWLQYKMGLGDSSRDKERPIKEIQDLRLSSMGESSERLFYSHWQKLMMQE